MHGPLFIELALGGLALLLGMAYFSLRAIGFLFNAALQAWAIRRHDRNNGLATAVTALGFLERYGADADPEAIEETVQELRIAYLNLGGAGNIRIDKVLGTTVDELRCNPACTRCHETNASGVRILTNLLLNAQEARVRAPEGGKLVAACDTRVLRLSNPRPEHRPGGGERTGLGRKSIELDLSEAGWRIEYRETADQFTAELQLAPPPQPCVRPGFLERLTRSESRRPQPPPAEPADVPASGSATSGGRTLAPDRAR